MSVIHPTAIVAAGAELGPDVAVGPYCVIGPHVKIGAGAVLKSHVVVEGHTTLGAGCTIFPFASLGQQTQDLKFKGGVTHVSVGDKTTVREYVTINSGTSDGEWTRVGAGCHIMATCHVAHGCEVGDGVIMANGASLAGHVKVEAMAVIGGLSGVHQFCRVGSMAMVGGMTKVTQDLPPCLIADGNPAAIHGVNLIGLQRRQISEEVQRSMKAAFKILYRSNLTTSEAMARVEAELPSNPQLSHFIQFVKTSERGILK
ncbi:MAG: acyl-ACP--UDP-N-acetylglucosamine O-acyltransferase [Kiritimatiellia bacterium]